MTPNIELHLFTNSTSSAPSTRMIENTYNSFQKTFNINLKATVWCDRNPMLDQAEQYLSNLRQLFPTVNETTSLSDGYVRAVKSASSEYMFMLEHDWEFLPTITHSLGAILDGMHRHQLIHIRFNKRANVAKKSDRDLQEVTDPQMPFCTTGFLSNNPHIIHRQRYLEQALPFIHVREKSFGIEKDISLAKLTGAIYGPRDYPATILHTDGKNWKD